MPPSLKPWDFTISLKRPITGAYAKIKTTLQATALPKNSSLITILANSTEMSVQSNYTLIITL